MTDIRNSEVFGEDGSRIAQDQKLIFVHNSLLKIGKVLDAQETLSLANRLSVDLRSGADDASRIELEPNGKSSAMDFPQTDRCQRSVPSPQLWPRQFLLFQKFARQISEWGLPMRAWK
jgi:hypothetical protein